MTATQLATERAKLDVEALVKLSEEINHSELWFSPIGGNRISELDLLELQNSMRELAGEYGYPVSLSPKDAGDFDKHCAQILHQNMRIHPAEAANLEIWMYMTTLLLPDVVRWRFMNSGGSTSIDRFIGSARGLRRNAFGRMWWRAHLFFYSQNPDDPYLLLSVLSEDDQIQISERPSLSGNPRLAKEVAVAYLTAQRHVDRNYIDVNRRQMLRESLKRISRIIPITMLDMLSESDSQKVFDEIFQASIEALIE